MSDPKNAWAASIKAGKAAEAAIAITFFTYLGMICEDNTREDVKATDLRGNAVIEVKHLCAPYPAAVSPAGLPPEEHITLDYANIMKADPRIMLTMPVDYTGKGIQTKGLYLLTVGAVQQIVRDNPGRVYTRSGRTSQDKVKKIGISTKECGRLAYPGMSLAGTVDAVNCAMVALPGDGLLLPDID